MQLWGKDTSFMLQTIPRTRGKYVLAEQRLRCQVGSIFQEKTNNPGVFVSDCVGVGDENLFLLTASASLNIWGELWGLQFSSWRWTSPVTALFPINDGLVIPHLPARIFTHLPTCLEKDPHRSFHSARWNGPIRINISLSSRTSFTVAREHTPLGFGSVN